ncbi:MAG: SynChlorMet cassette radical SAM/SPASM protein ScmF [candidate division KSB1 bacterium]|nr:SynChlorMet cassette radical SAM/SPASM protein ScmF [candidate division KSB1 bacterium]MDZ7347023.1 SynChlorMet cassette radical SAM/SPASM protein ScmF [candidate division KSB1 bacterium]
MHRSPLREIYFYLTRGCNLSCRHCWLSKAPSGSEHRDSFLPIELFRHAVEEALPLGLQRVKLTGGEPMLHPHFEELIAFLQAKNLGVNIETNVTLCTPQQAKQLADLRSCFVAVSLDGADAETHDAVRNKKGAFEETITGIRYLTQVGIKPQVIFSLFRRNAEQIPRLIQLAEELGVSSLKFNIVQPIGRALHLYDQKETLSVAELIELGRRIDMVFSRSSKVPLIFDYPAAFRPLSTIYRQGNGVCRIEEIIGVLPTGEYALCGIGESVRELVFGRVGQDPLAKIWSRNKILKRLHDHLADHLQGVCSVCVMKKTCKGSCIAHNYFREKKLFAPFWFCQEAYEQGLFPTSRLTNVKK